MLAAQGPLEVLDDEFKVRPVDDVLCRSPAAFSYGMQTQEESAGASRAGEYDKLEKHKKLMVYAGNGDGSVHRIKVQGRTW